MTCHDIVFGDGLREIRPVMDGFYELDVFPVTREGIPGKKRKRRKKALSAREAMVLISCIAPVVLGWVFLTVMIQHTAFYMAYWIATFGWIGVVLYANKKERRPIGKRQHSAHHKVIISQKGRECK